MIIAILAFLLVVYLAGVATAAWGLMLGVGVAHNIWWAAMPTMGYGTAFEIILVASIPGLILSVIFGALKAS